MYICARGGAIGWPFGLWAHTVGGLQIGLRAQQPAQRLLLAAAHTHKQTNAYERVHVARPIPDSALSNAPTAQWLGLPDLLRIATMLLASNHCATRRFTKAITFYHQMG